MNDSRHELASPDLKRKISFFELVPNGKKLWKKPDLKSPLSLVVASSLLISSMSVNDHSKAQKVSPEILRRILILITFGLIAIALPIYALKVYDKRDYTDFGVYYLAAT